MEKVYAEVKLVQDKDLQVASMASKHSALENETNNIRNELSQTIVKHDATSTQIQEQELDVQSMKTKME